MVYGRAARSLVSVATVAAVASIAIVRAQTPPAAQQTQSQNPSSATVIINAITQPSERHKLTFPAAGVIIDVPVKEGDVVKQGQVLLQQDDYLEQKELEKAQLEAASGAKVEAAVADYNAKKHIYERKKDTYDKGGANLQEVEDAQLDMVLREKQIKVAQEDLDEAKIKAEQEAKRVKDMKLTSPVDGLVEKLELEVGEMADPQKPEGAAWVVKNDPLYVEIRDMSSAQASHLHPGDKLQVRYPGETDWQEAKVIYRDPVVDAASDTQLVRLTLPNPTNRDSGLQIQVQLPPDAAAAGEAREKTAAGN
jgi:multidrug efflux pump subunit AcrA (membrane-fusion protein)